MLPVVIKLVLIKLHFQNLTRIKLDVLNFINISRLDHFTSKSFSDYDTLFRRPIHACARFWPVDIYDIVTRLAPLPFSPAKWKMSFVQEVGTQTWWYTSGESHVEVCDFYKSLHGNSLRCVIIEWFRSVLSSLDFGILILWLCVMFTQVCCVSKCVVIWRNIGNKYTWYKTSWNSPKAAPGSTRKRAPVGTMGYGTEKWRCLHNVRMLFFNFVHFSPWNVAVRQIP